MTALLVLIPVTLALIGFAVVLFFWAVRHGQFRNLDTPEILPLLETREPAQHDHRTHAGQEPSSPEKESTP